jgi:hypothetical protein
MAGGQDLEGLLDDFAERGGDGAFPGLTRAAVAQGLRQRLADPVSLDQGAATFSGPAAFLFCLLRDAPELYARYVTDLFEHGRADLGGLAVEPGAGCREGAPEARQIAAVDWVALASLRDTEMAVAGYDAANDTGQAATSPTVLARWFAAAGYRHVRNDADAFFPKGRRELTQLRALFLQRRRVCLFISADMLISFGQEVRILRPNQWVVLTEPVTQVGEGVALTVYQWGTTRRVPPTGGLALDRFCRNFYGCVAAMPPRYRCNR